MAKTDKHSAKPTRRRESPPVSTDTAGRVADTKGDVGFRGGRRPDSPLADHGASDERAPLERARPRDTGRQGS